jgi:[CysO sulfur-carrier protein]-S-L-cysteine hydrolase
MLNWLRPRPLIIPAGIFAEIERHLRSALPNEGCGLLAVVRKPSEMVACRFFPGENIDASPTRYTMDPSAVMAALEEIERQDWRLGAIVHSHPDSPATPSKTDLREFHYPGALMTIANLFSTTMILRAWEIDPFLPEPREVPIEVLPPGDAARYPARDDSETK